MSSVITLLTTATADQAKHPIEIPAVVRRWPT